MRAGNSATPRTAEHEERMPGCGQDGLEDRAAGAVPRLRPGGGRGRIGGRGRGGRGGGDVCLLLIGQERLYNVQPLADWPDLEGEAEGASESGREGGLPAH